MELNRCAYTILGILRARNSTDKVHGLTINEISAKEKVSKPNTIHKRVKEMQSEGYKGSKDIIQKYAESQNETVNGMINRLLENEIPGIKE